jgi:hypothetical protein
MNARDGGGGRSAGGPPVAPCLGERRGRLRHGGDDLRRRLLQEARRFLHSGDGEPGTKIGCPAGTKACGGQCVSCPKGGVSVPLHDAAHLTLIYVKKQVQTLQQGALSPPNPRVELGPGAYNVAAGPPFRLVCDSFGGTIALNQVMFECARLP